MRIEFGLVEFTPNLSSLDAHLMRIEAIHIQRLITSESKPDRHLTVWANCGNHVRVACSNRGSWERTFSPGGKSLKLGGNCGIGIREQAVPSSLRLSCKGHHCLPQVVK